VKYIECVPNISEGRDNRKIAATLRPLSAVKDLRLLHRDSGYDANRTVVTFAGPPAAVLEGARVLICESLQHIDMRCQRGAHPRLGAVDVCPFVPLQDSSLEECAALARNFGAQIADEFGLPVFLYEAAATNESRKNLAAIRRGEFEGLAEKLRQPQWTPDFGPCLPHPTAGAIVIGARDFLIAFNVNLSTRELLPAVEIAAGVRESGDRRRGIRGGLAGVKALAWFMPEFDCAQVSMNLTDFHRNGLYEAYTECVKRSRAAGCSVTGSELIGIVPRAAMLDAGRKFLGSPEHSPADAEIISAAVRGLGLSQFKEFKPQERILEYLPGMEVLLQRNLR
jgi:glutamate formiminotransferase/formiminotetrahydrofolate cyclodeaminase